MENIIGIADKRRLFAAYIDNFIVVILSLVAVANTPTENAFVRGAILVLTYLLYFFLLEGALAKTPGKMMNRLKVVRVDGTPARFKEALLRTLLRLIETNPLLLGGLPAGLSIMSTKQRQRLGDLAAGTVVVSSKLR